MRAVELKSAYHWFCDDCGQGNFALPQKAELTEEERENAYRTFHEIEEFESLPDGWRDFEMVYIPDTVKCEKCMNIFQTCDERIE